MGHAGHHSTVLETPHCRSLDWLSPRDTCLLMRRCPHCSGSLQTTVEVSHTGLPERSSFSSHMLRHGSQGMTPSHSWPGGLPVGAASYSRITTPYIPTKALGFCFKLRPPSPAEFAFVLGALVFSCHSARFSQL